MVTEKGIFIAGAIITVLLFFSIYSANKLMNNEREQAILDKMDDMLEEYEEIQTVQLMSSIFGEDMACIGLESRLSHMDKTLWDAGSKIDKYRAATEEFMKDPFYIEQKRKFNRNEAMYFSLLKEMKKNCEVNQTIILFFFKKAEECKKCDSQSFVLTDLNREIGEEISIFSFDADLGLPSVDILVKYYNITRYPCVVIEDRTYCGLYDKDGLTSLLCKTRNHSICT